MEQRHYRPLTPYEVYCDMPEDERCELINGKIVMMGTPNTDHADICGDIFNQIYNYLRGKRCRVYMEHGLRFEEGEPVNNALRPDIMVVCDPSKIRSDSVVGAPDFIIEVISPSNSKRDTSEKLDIYMKAGVQEYWIIDPVLRTVHIHRQGDAYSSAIAYIYSDRIPVTVLDDFSIDMTTVFPPVQTKEQLSGDTVNP
ncbi:hypothetical protein FACS1894184_06860 [Clostridia bacterium]|nr:hypothetical protein FACS1894184_06860 [Clostridia bacterium]